MNQSDLESSNYLEHHGILGQKWGIRRFQNKDGSLTNAGRKRYGVDGSDSRIKFKTSFEKKKAKLAEKERKMTEREEIQRRKNALKERQEKLKNSKKSESTKRNEDQQDRRKQQLDNERERNRRSVKDMTDDELRAVINRMKLEKEYREAIKTPEKKTGAQVIGDILIRSGQQALGEASKAIMVSYMKKAFGVQDEKKKSNSNNNNDQNRDSNSNRQRQNRRDSSNDGGRTTRELLDLLNQQTTQRDRVAEYWRRRRGS